jgi:hypothetical protein
MPPLTREWVRLRTLDAYRMPWPVPPRCARCRRRLRWAVLFKSDRGETRLLGQQCACKLR